MNYELIFFRTESCAKINCLFITHVTEEKFDNLNKHKSSIKVNLQL